MPKPLTRLIKTSTKSGISIPATVVDIYYGKASVRLSNNGALMRRLEIVGGPVSVGDKVKVDFTTPEPTVVAVGQEGLTVEEMEDWLKRNSDMAWGNQGLTQITISLYHDGALLSMYASTITGLGSAIQDSVAGDVIYLPDVDLEGVSITLVPETDLVGISSRQSILRGTVYLEPGCTLENLKVLMQTSSPTTNAAVQIQVTTPTDPLLQSKIKGCEILSYNCGAGISYGIRFTGGCDAVIENTTIEGDSVRGQGYAFSEVGNNNIDILHCNYYGKNSIFNEE